MLFPIFSMGMRMDSVVWEGGVGISTRDWEGMKCKKNSSVDAYNVTTGQALNCAVNRIG